MNPLSEWAEAYLDELVILLMQDPAAHSRYGAEVSRVIQDVVSALRSRVQNDTSYPNARYNRQGELAASLVVLGMEYPQVYASLMQHVATASMRDLLGVLRLASVLNALSDDHDYILISSEPGEQQLFHESALPKNHAFVPLTSPSELCAVTVALLERAGFGIASSSTPRA